MPNRIQTRVSPTFYERVKRQAQADGHRIGEFVRIALEFYLTEKEKTKGE